MSYNRNSRYVHERNTKNNTSHDNFEDRVNCDDPILAKIDKIIELTQRSVEDACLALHESDNQLEAAIEFLFENPLSQGGWCEAGKKKRDKKVTGNDDAGGWACNADSNDLLHDSNGDFNKSNLDSRGGRGGRGRGRVRGRGSGDKNRSNRGNRGGSNGNFDNSTTKGGFNSSHVGRGTRGSRGNRGGRGGRGNRDGGPSFNSRNDQKPPSFEDFTKKSSNNNNSENWDMECEDEPASADVPAQSLPTSSPWGSKDTATPVAPVEFNEPTDVPVEASDWNGRNGDEASLQFDCDNSGVYVGNDESQAYDESTGYDPHANSSYDPRIAYDTSVTYDPAATYDPQSNYDSQAVYEPQPSYEPQMNYDSQTATHYQQNTPYEQANYEQPNEYEQGMFEGNSSFEAKQNDQFVRRTRNNLTNCYTDTKIPVKAVEMPHEASSKSEFQFGTWEKKSADIALKKESLATSVNEKRGKNSPVQMPNDNNFTNATNLNSYTSLNVNSDQYKDEVSPDNEVESSFLSKLSTTAVPATSSIGGVSTPNTPESRSPASTPFTNQDNKFNDNNSFSENYKNSGTYNNENFVDTSNADLSTDLSKMALSVNNEMPCSTNNSSYLTTSKPSISHPGAAKVSSALPPGMQQVMPHSYLMQNIQFPTYNMIQPTPLHIRGYEDMHLVQPGMPNGREANMNSYNDPKVSNRLDSSNTNTAYMNTNNQTSYFNYYQNAQTTQQQNAAAAAAGMLGPNAYGYQHAVQYQITGTGPSGNASSQQPAGQFMKQYSHYNPTTAATGANSTYDPNDDFKYSKSSSIDHSSSFKHTQANQNYLPPTQSNYMMQNQHDSRPNGQKNNSKNFSNSYWNPT